VTPGAKTEYALDASALLALMLNEPGHDKVRAILDHAYVHSVNIAEVVGKLVREGVPTQEAGQMVGDLGLDIDEKLPTSQAVLCGELLARTRRHGLSLGDSVCLTVAACRGATAVTADRQWKKLNHQRVRDAEFRVDVIR